MTRSYARHTLPPDARANGGARALALRPLTARRAAAASRHAQVENTLQIRNVSLLPEIYDVEALPESLTRRFVLPCAPPADRDDATRRKTLGPRKSWDSSLFTANNGVPGKPAGDAPDDSPWEPLVLWTPPEGSTEADGWSEAITVDEILCRYVDARARERPCLARAHRASVSHIATRTRALPVSIRPRPPATCARARLLLRAASCASTSATASASSSRR